VSHDREQLPVIQAMAPSSGPGSLEPANISVHFNVRIQLGGLIAIVSVWQALRSKRPSISLRGEEPGYDSSSTVEKVK